MLGPARQLALLLRTGQGTGVRQVVDSASSPQLESNKATRTGRHRAPSRVRRTIKIIAVAAPAVALAGAFVASQVRPQADPVAKTMATYHSQTVNSAGVLAAGSEQLQLPRQAGAGEDSESGKTATTAKPRQSVKAGSPHRLTRTANRPAASPTPSATKSGSRSGSGSANLKAAVQRDIAKGNNLLAVAQYLVEHGYSKVAAAGVAGCVVGESVGNPESVGSGGGGLIGWTPIGSAAPNPNIITGNPAKDMMTQLSDLLYYNSTEIGQSWVSQLNAMKDPVAAADFYSANFEKPAVLYSDVRPSVAQQILSELGG